jgi:ABC-type Na+ efflux pump permease subunit
MYRDDLAATHARLDSLQRELASAQSQSVSDQQRIAMLTAQLQATQAALARIGSVAPAPAYPSFPLPPRSGTVLTLGILSLVLCTVLGPFAWSMGTEELRRIESGLTAPHGRSTAVAGRICGIVATCLLCFSLLMVMFMLVVAPH